MTTMDLTAFDTEELLHLAISLSGQQRYADALNCLKQAAKLSPENGAVAYFTGVIYAQIGLYERSVALMQRAVQMDPNLHIAHFQIGLLYFTSGRIAQALAAWKPLDGLGEQEPLFLFKAGLEALSLDDFDGCREYLTRGIELNTQNEPLNADMRKVLERIEGLSTQADDEPSDEADDAHAASPSSSGL
jgi:tetratricopeptide (TPR) repeat protein